MDQGQEGRAWRVGHGQFDPLSGVLVVDGRQVTLRPRTAALFDHLVRHAGRVVTKAELLQSVWPDVVVTEDSLVQCVKEIRQALGHEGREWIRTVPRQGYAFVHDVGAYPKGIESVRWPEGVLPAVLLGLALLVAGGVWLLQQARLHPAPPLSMVVLPLNNLSGDPGIDNAVDDLTEDLTTALSRMPGTLVIAPSTAFTFKGRANDVRTVGKALSVRYVLDGALRDAPPKWRLTVRLADSTTAAQVWSEEFAAEALEVRSLRAEVVARVAASLGLRLVHREAERSRREKLKDPTAEDLLTRARAVLRWSAPGTDEVRQARLQLEEAVRRDDSLAEAWGLLAKAYRGGGDVRFSPTRQSDLRRAGEATDRALALAPDSADAHGARAWLLYNRGQMAQALAAFDRAIELNPSDAALLAHSGAALVMLGRPQEAIESIERAIRISPRDPELPLWHLFRGVADLHLGRAEAAVDWLTQSVQGRPSSAFPRLMLASALGAAGRDAEARAEMAAFQTLHPGFTLGRFREIEPSDAPAFMAQRQRVYEGLRRAGMPE